MNDSKFRRILHKTYPCFDRDDDLDSLWGKLCEIYGVNILRSGSTNSIDASIARILALEYLRYNPNMVEWLAL